MMHGEITSPILVLFILRRVVLMLRAKFKLVAVSGKLYAVGGHGLSTVECYVPEQDWWTCVSSMPDPLTEFSACECQGMIYVMGGYTARGVYLHTHAHLKEAVQ